MFLKFALTTSRVFTKILEKKLLVIIAIAFVLRFFLINELFPFEFDQQTPALAAYDFFKDHKLTLVGQELSFYGFFLGPIHTWISFIPYGLCNLMPDCVPYFFLILSLVSMSILYLVLKEIYGTKTAVIATSIQAFSFSEITTEIGTNSNYFIFFSSTLSLFFIYKYFQGNNKFLILGALVAGIATVNFNPVFIFSALTFFLAALIRPKRDLKLFAIAIGIFFINYLPLVIFNYRHQNLLLNAIQKFSDLNVSSSVNQKSISTLAVNILGPFYSNYLFQKANLLFVGYTSVLLVIGVYIALKSKSKLQMILPAWIFITFLGFVFYSGHIPDYYFLQITLPFVILISLVLRKNAFLFVSFFSIFLFLNMQRIINYESVINYQIKKEIVEYLISDSGDKTFNLYYQMPPGLNTGYGYLTKAMGGQVIDGDKNLYILEVDPKSKPNLDKYYKAIPGRSIDLKEIGFVSIVSVK